MSERGQYSVQWKRMALTSSVKSPGITVTSPTRAKVPVSASGRNGPRHRIATTVPATTACATTSGMWTSGGPKTAAYGASRGSIGPVTNTRKSEATLYAPAASSRAFVPCLASATRGPARQPQRTATALGSCHNAS